MKKIYLGLAILFGGMAANAQYITTIQTGRNGGNGSSGVTFNITAKKTIIVDTIWSAIFGGAVGDEGVFQLWSKKGGINGAPTIASPTWSVVNEGKMTAKQTGTTTLLSPLPGSMILWGGQTYGFYLGNTDGMAGTVYTTYASGSDSAANADMLIKLGTNVGYGGALPNPANTPRSWNGAISYTTYNGTSTLEAGVNALASPTNWGLNNGAYTVKMNVTNIGLDTVHTLKLSWQQGTGTVYTDTLTGLNILPGTTYTYNHTSTWTPTAVGTYSLNISMTDINGGNDIIASNNNSTLTVTVKNQYDMGVISTISNKIFALGFGALPINGYVQNYGSETITNFVVKYMVNGVYKDSVLVTGANIAPFSGTYAFTYPTGWTPAAAGSANIQLYVSSMNGNIDQNNVNDTLSHALNVLSSGYPFDVLYEGFSSSTCGPCVSANSNMKTVFDARTTGGYNFVKYQMNWPSTGDPYYNADGGLRRTLYGINSIPSWFINGSAFDPRSLTTADFDDIKNANKVAPFGIETRYGVNGRTMNVDIKVNSAVDVNNANLKLFVALVEDVTYNNAQTNGETEFHHVVHKMLPSGSGTSLGTVAAGGNKTFTFQRTFTSTTVPEDMSNMFVVTWLQDVSTKEVFQSNKGIIYGVGTHQVDGVSGIKAVYPNPAAEVTTIAYELNNNESVSYQLVNNLGQVVASKKLGNQGVGRFNETLNVASLAEGVYMFKLTVGDQVYTQKVSVRK
jgi:hypothetical protein